MKVVEIAKEAPGEEDKWYGQVIEREEHYV